MLFSILANSLRNWQGNGGAISPPVNITPPVVSGIVYVGNVLTCTSPGVWLGAGPITYTYNWRRNGTAIGGSNQPIRTVNQTDEGAVMDCQVTATNAAGAVLANGNQLHLWVPTDAGTPRGWWDAYSPSTITIATGVSQWNNRGSQDGGTLVRAEGAGQPAYSATGWDGVRPAITWDGIDDYIRNTGDGSWARNSSGETAAACAAPDDTITPRAIFHIATSTATASRFSLRCVPNALLSCAGRRLDSDGYKEMGKIGYSTATRLFTAQADHSNDQARAIVDGSIPAWDTPAWGVGLTSDTPNRSLAVGSDNITALWKGKIAEVVVYRGMLSDANLDKLHGYLAWRWGVVARLPALHPFKTAPPTP